jgi:plasmid stability protein
MATLTVRNLDDDVVRRLRVRAAGRGRSAEADHRDILRAALAGDDLLAARRQAADRLANFRSRTAGRGSASALELLADTRAERLLALADADAGGGAGA